MSGFNPLAYQGLLNRVLTHVVVTNFQGLNVTASFMSRALTSLTLEGDFTRQEPTATGIVNSPEPFVMGQLVVSILRSQSLASAWLAQMQSSTILGDVVTYSDSTVFPAITLRNCSLISIDPGPYDGQDPTTKITIKGVLPINASLWAGI
ncbi:MAG: hypothetical protein ACYDCJ_12545 [Gammaproteobacteria bacterium]